MRPIWGLVLLAGLGLGLWLGALGALAPAAAPPSPLAQQPLAAPASPLEVQPLFLSARLRLGATAVQTLSVSNLDAHLPLTYSVYVLPSVPLRGVVPWLAVAPTWGRLPPGGRATVDVTFYADEELVFESINLATVWVSGEGFSQPLTVNVPALLEVNPLRVRPPLLQVALRPGGQASQPLTLTNAFAPALDFEVTPAGGETPPAWLAASPLIGTLAGGQSRRVTVDLDAAALSPGLYRADLLVDNDLVSDFVLTVPVTLAVQPWPIYLPLLARPGAAGAHIAP